VQANVFMLLIATHVAIICISNILVQHPLVLFDFHTTWGAFSYPLVFIFTDLTTRIKGAPAARKIIFIAMVPGLTASLLIANWIEYGRLWVQNDLVMRIALAGFCAYLSGQLLDIYCFQKLREQTRWWVAPSVASIFGNCWDTYCFFFIAFYHSSMGFLAGHWLEIATVDLVFKLAISIVSFLPFYGLILAWVQRRESINLVLTTHGAKL